MVQVEALAPPLASDPDLNFAMLRHGSRQGPGLEQLRQATLREPNFEKPLPVVLHSVRRIEVELDLELALRWAGLGAYISLGPARHTDSR